MDPHRRRTGEAVLTSLERASRLSPPQDGLARGLVSVHHHTEAAARSNPSEHHAESHKLGRLCLSGFY